MGVLVGKPAPDFTAAAVLGNGEIIDMRSFPSPDETDIFSCQELLKEFSL